jgi:predicted adenine nucleotide alpha hydrolase (AANH) superfamily ATPase
VFDAPQAFFFNGDNFDTREEYDRRAAAMAQLSPDAIIEPYQPRVFNNCADCIAYRLRRCAEYGRANGFTHFTTTLTVSPHKDTATINAQGRAIGVEFGIEFVELDLKRTNPRDAARNAEYGARGGFAQSVMRSRELGLYRQNYCGCGRQD